MIHPIREGCYDSGADNLWDVQGSQEAPASPELQASQVHVPTFKTCYMNYIFIHVISIHRRQRTQLLYRVLP